MWRTGWGLRQTICSSMGGLHSHRVSNCRTKPPTDYSLQLSHCLPWGYTCATRPGGLVLRGFSDRIGRVGPRSELGTCGRDVIDYVSTDASSRVRKSRAGPAESGAG